MRTDSNMQARAVAASEGAATRPTLVRRADARVGSGRVSGPRRPTAVSASLQLSAWFRGVPFEAVLDCAQRRFAEHGLTRRAVEHGAFFDARDVRLAFGSLGLRIAPRSEDHVVIEASLQGPLATAVGRLLPTFEALVRDEAAPVAECILAEAEAPITPFFTHSFFHGLALAPRHVPRPDGGVTRLAPPHRGFWGRGTRRLHFVSRWLLGAPSVPPPDQWSSQLGAPWRLTTGGILFDCGWSAAWSTNASALTGS